MSTDALGTGGGAGTPAPHAGPSDDERAELQRLREDNERLTGIVGALEPYADDITRFVKDEGYRSYVRESSKFYDNAQEQHKPQVSPEIAAVRDEIMEAIRPQREMVENYNRAQREDLEHRKARTFEEGRAIVTPYLEAHPELRSRAFGATLDALQADAVERNVPFKEVWDNYISGFAPAREERKTPPRSLRANAAEIGIPAATEQRTETTRADGSPKPFREIALEVARRVGRGRAS